MGRQVHEPALTTNKQTRGLGKLVEGLMGGIPVVLITTRPGASKWVVRGGKALVTIPTCESAGLRTGFDYKQRAENHARCFNE